MKIEEAQKILKLTSKDHSQKQVVLRGLQILARYNDDLSIISGYETIFAENFETSVSKMTEEEVTTMASLGWFEEEDTWTVHV